MIVWVSGLTTAYILWLFVVSNRRDLKYNPDIPTPLFMLEEAVRNFGGIVILTVYEVVLVKTGRVETCTEMPSESSKVLWILFITHWSDFHFYVIHRMLHDIPLLYRHVHRIHHKSYNTNPISGLSMHPVEHLIYFSAVLLPFILPAAPFWVIRVIGLNLIIYPLPGHIGIEPFDLHHWTHHNEFNYNYGSSELYDILFGTTYEGYMKRIGDQKTKSDINRANDARIQKKLVSE